MYEHDEPPSPHQLRELVLDVPIRLVPGQTCGLYVHSAEPSDEGLVYNNQRFQYTHDGTFLRIHPGIAHTSQVPFSANQAWGAAWRERREFVGSVRFGTKLVMWTPDAHFMFPPSYRRAVFTVLAAQRRPESGKLGRVPAAVIYKVFNMCRWDWFPEAVESAQREQERYERRPSDVDRPRFQALRRLFNLPVAAPPPPPAVDDDDDDEMTTTTTTR